VLATLMDAADSTPRRRFRPPVLPTLATVVAVSVFTTAGFWQRDRMEQKQALRIALDAAAAREVVPLPDVRDWMAWRFRPVVATGRFDGAHQILVDNKVQGGRTGYHVVTPLALTDGRVVLVDRGWIEGGVTRAQVPQVAVPAGVISVRGRINLPVLAYLELQRDTVSGPVWQNLDPARFSVATGVEVLPVVIEQTGSLGAFDTLVREWPAPDAGVDKHRIYMMQWFAFAAMAAVLWLYFTLRRSA